MASQKAHTLLFVILGICVVSLPAFVRAATLSAVPGANSVSTDNILTVSVRVNTQGSTINTADAVLQFPNDLLEAVAVSKSGSIFNLWVEDPNFSNTTGRVSFNGGIANPGYNGSSGQLISITFRAKKAGTASIIFGDASVRANDGLGTDVLSGTSNADVTIVAPPAAQQPVRSAPASESAPAKSPAPAPVSAPTAAHNTPPASPSLGSTTQYGLHTIPFAAPATSSDDTLMSRSSQTIRLLSITVPIVALVVLIMLILAFGWFRFFAMRSRMRKDLMQAHQRIHQAFKVLSEETTAQLKSIEHAAKHRGLTAAEEKAAEELRATILDAEKYIARLLEKIESADL